MVAGLQTQSSSKTCSRSLTFHATSYPSSSSSVRSLLEVCCGRGSWTTQDSFFRVYSSFRCLKIAFLEANEPSLQRRLHLPISCHHRVLLSDHSADRALPCRKTDCTLVAEGSRAWWGALFCHVSSPAFTRVCNRSISHCRVCRTCSKHPTH